MNNEQLVCCIQAGDSPAEHMLELYNANRGFLAKLCRKYAGFAEIDDLMQEAYIALYGAVDKFNPGMGYKFLTYAGRIIEPHLARYARAQGLIHIPERLQVLILKYEHFVTNWGGNGIPKQGQIAAYLGIPLEKVESVEKAARIRQIGSLDAPLLDSEDRALGEAIPSGEDVEADVLWSVVQEELRGALWPLVGNLPQEERDALITIYKYGQKRTPELRALEAKGLYKLQSKARRLSRFLDTDEGAYSEGLRGNGIGSFRRTWTSSTERTAIFRL